MDAQTIALIVTTVLALLGAGIITKLARVIREMKEFFGVLSGALEDRMITSTELARIVKEACDVKDAAMAVVAVIQSKPARRAPKP